MLGLLAIALPTLSIKTSDNTYFRIRGLDPKDISSNYVISDFSFRPSLDLQGGTIQTLSVNLDSFEKDKRKEELEKIKNQIFIRLLQSRISNFEINTLVSVERNEYKLVLKYPDNIDPNLMQVIITPGYIQFYADNSLNVTDNSMDDSAYGNRIASNLSNNDIDSVKLVSDARCYFNEPTTPRNYCLAINFKSTSYDAFKAALYNNPTPTLPLLVVIDGAPIAVQTGGQIFNAASPGTELLVYPVVDDTITATSVLGSLMSSLPLSSSITQDSADKLSPLLNENILLILKISLLSAVVISDILLMFYFKKKGLFAVGASSVFIITNIAVMKMFNLILDVPLIIGFILAYVLFMVVVMNLMYKLRTASKGALEDAELDTHFENHKSEYRNITLMIVAISFVMSYLGTVFSISLFTSFAFGILLGFTIFYVAFPVLLPLIFLKSKKWQIW